MKSPLSLAIAEHRKVKMPEDKPQMQIEEVMAILDPEMKKQLFEMLKMEMEQGSDKGGMEDAQGALKSTPGEKMALMQEGVSMSQESDDDDEENEIGKPRGLAERLQMKAKSLMKGRA